MTPMLQFPMPRFAKGRSLIELMVALLIGSLVLAAVLVITAGSSSIGRRSDSLGSLTDSGQVALQLIGSEVRMAGYSEPRMIFAAGYLTKMMPFAGLRGCDNGFANSAVGANLLTCGGAANSGAFSVVYEADDFNALLVNGAPTDCRGFGLISTIPGGIGNAARPATTEDKINNVAYWRVENRYFIANANTDGEPSLMCTGSGGGAPFATSIPLVRGVERMVIRYGVGIGTIDASRSDLVVQVQPNLVRYMTAAQIDGNPDWVGEATDVRWQRVISMQICLETRGDLASAEPGFAYRNCDGIMTTPTDGRARRAVFSTMSLRNRTAAQNSAIGIGGV